MAHQDEAEAGRSEVSTVVRQKRAGSSDQSNDERAEGFSVSTSNEGGDEVKTYPRMALGGRFICMLVFFTNPSH